MQKDRFAFLDSKATEAVSEYDRARMALADAQSRLDAATEAVAMLAIGRAVTTDNSVDRLLEELK